MTAAMELTDQSAPIPQGMGDGEYSPYRVYMTNVLTQVKAHACDCVCHTFIRSRSPAIATHLS